MKRTEILNRSGAIRQHILERMSKDPKGITSSIVSQFQISRQAATRYLKQMVQDGQLIAEGTTKDRTYKSSASANTENKTDERDGGFEVFLKDILISIEKIKSYLGTPPPEDSLQDDMIYDAIIRNLEVIGEAVENIPESVRSAHAEIDWDEMVEIREMLIHEYFDIEDAIILDLLKNKLPDLYLKVQMMIGENVYKEQANVSE